MASLLPVLLTLTDDPRLVHAAWGMWAKPAANGQLDHPSRIFLSIARAVSARFTRSVPSFSRWTPWRK